MYSPLGKLSKVAVSKFAKSANVVAGCDDGAETAGAAGGAISEKSAKLPVGMVTTTGGGGGWENEGRVGGWGGIRPG